MLVDRLRKAKFNKHAGFSFMEVMLSVFVLSIGIVGVMPLFVSSLRESLDIRDQVVASMLAQEGIELVQNLRDNNRVRGETAFQSNFPNSSQDNCRIDYNDSDVSDCNNGHSYTLNLNGYYAHTNSGTATKFQRKITLDFKVSNTQLVVTSIVIWGGGAFPAISDCNTAHKCAYASLILTKW